MKVPKGKKNNLRLTFWPSHWNTCEEYGIHTHPLELKNNLNAPQELFILKLCSCNAETSDRQQWETI